MAINPNGVAVPAQSKNLDTTTVTTSYGVVHRQVVTIADPETPTSYVTLTGSSLNVNITTASIAVTAASLPLPTGAATSALQTTGNTSLSTIITNTTGVSTAANQTTGNASLSTIATNTTGLNSLTKNTGIVDANTIRVSPATDVTQAISAVSLPLPTGAATESTLVALSAKVVNGYSFHRSASNATTTIKSGAGVLKRVTVNTLGSASNTCTIYDNTAGSGTIIAVIDPTLAQGTFEYDLVFSTGLTIVTATGSAADLTLVYQ